MGPRAYIQQSVTTHWKYPGTIGWPFSGMLWEGIEVNRKPVYKTFKSFPTIFRGQGQEVLERPKLNYRLQSNCDGTLFILSTPSKPTVSISVSG